MKQSKSLPNTTPLEVITAGLLKLLSDMSEERFTRLKAKVQEFNSGATKWGKNVHTTAKEHLNYLDVDSGGSKVSHHLKENFRVNFHRQKEGGVSRIWRIGFGFPPTGAYLHYGAGRGYGGSGESLWKDSKGILRSTNPESIGKMGTGNRRPKDWFNPAVESNLQKMDKIVGEYGDDLALNTAGLLIGEAFSNEKTKGANSGKKSTNSSFGSKYKQAKMR